MDSSMVIGRRADQFGVSRDSQDALHPFQVDGAHVIDRLDKLLLADAA